MTKIKDQWKEVDERFDKKFILNPTSNWTAVSNKDVKSFLHSELEKVRQEAKIEGVRLVCLPVYDHSKCPLPQTCIGYQNAESDLEHIKEELINNLKTNELDKNKQ